MCTLALHDAVPSCRAESSRAESSRAESTKAESSSAESSRAESSRAESSRAQGRSPESCRADRWRLVLESKEQSGRAQ